MRDQKLYESVGKYIDKYYIDKPDDIKLDKEMKSIFDRISEFRKKKATKKCNAEEVKNCLCRYCKVSRIRFKN